LLSTGIHRQALDDIASNFAVIIAVTLLSHFHFFKNKFAYHTTRIFLSHLVSNFSITTFLPQTKHKIAAKQKTQNNTSHAIGDPKTTSNGSN
jgi:hypothetical protein